MYLVDSPASEHLRRAQQYCRSAAAEDTAASHRRTSLVSEIVDPPKSSVSYLDSSPVRETPYTVTSLQRQRQDLLRAFPSLLSDLRWNPYVQNSSDVQFPCEACSQPELRMSHHHKRTSFSNQCTMTSHTVDASCSIKKTSPSRLRDAGVSESPARTSRRSHNLYGEDIICCPSALKICKDFEDIGECIPRRRTRHQALCDSNRDVEDEVSSSMLSFSKIHRKRGSRYPYPSATCHSGPSDEPHRQPPVNSCSGPSCEPPPPPPQRRMLYNEGISDQVTEGPRCVHQPRAEQVYPVRWPDTYIPHGHNFKSKYHDHCQDEPSVRWCRGGCGSEIVRHFGYRPKRPLRSPEVAQGCGMRRDCSPSPPRVPACNHRQLLCADRDINAFVRYPRSRSNSRSRVRVAERHYHECCSKKSHTRTSRCCNN